MAQAQRGIGRVGLEVRRVGRALERLGRALRSQPLHLGVPGRARPAGSRSSSAAQRSTLPSAASTVFCSGAPSSASAAAAAAAQRLALARRLAAGRSPAASAPCPGCAGGRTRCAPCRRACAGCRRRSCAAARRSRPARGTPPARRRTRRGPAARPPPRRAPGTRGRCPRPARGCAAARAQKPWIVEIQAASASRAWLDLVELDEARREPGCLSWAAAFSVNVIARIESTATPSSQHGAHEALDQHRGLAGARARAHQDRAVAPLDRRQLLLGEPHGVSTRQIEGCEQPPR